MASDGKLGRGLDSLMGGDTTAGGEVLNLPMDQIAPNPFQPREAIDPAGLEGLIESIQENGILQPITVRPSTGGYELVTGERRFRAAQQLGMAEVPAVVRDVNDEKMLELALIENIQREDLNPIEKARAFRQLTDNFHLTQEETARRVGQDRSTVTNIIRLLELPPEVQELVSAGGISMSHAKALLSLADARRQIGICKLIIKRDLSVRETERICGGGKKRAKGRKKPPLKDAHVRDLEEELRLRLGTKVQIVDKKGKGKIIIDYYNTDDFERIMGCIKEA
ncbi:MAG: ParB/RepB/Spo0J family partition protein [Planctomycetes bacterium]|nr:ParB/RepB/Spo0J family partition protein [Planctomycetota bacterium]